MVQENSKSEGENKNLVSTSKFSQNEKPTSNEKTNDQVTDSSKTLKTNPFEVVEKLILKLTDKMIANEIPKKVPSSTREDEKNKIINSSKASTDKPVPTRQPVSVYLAPIENVKPASNVQAVYIDKRLNENASNQDINLHNNSNCNLAEKSQSYENLSLGTPKGKRTTIFVPVNNDSYNLDLTPPSSISSENVNKKSSKIEINPGLFADTSIPQLMTKKKSQRQILESSLLINKKTSISGNQQGLTSLFKNSTIIPTEAVDSKQKMSKCKHGISINEKSMDKSFENVNEKGYKNCPECCTSKIDMSKRKDTCNERINEKIQDQSKKFSTLGSVKNNSTPRTSICSTASLFKNTLDSSQNNERSRQLNENIYTTAPTRNRNRNMDNDSGIDNPMFNDDISMYPYTCKIKNDNGIFIPTKNMSLQQKSKKLVSLKNIPMKSEVKIESPKISRFYDMQTHNDMEKNTSRFNNEKYIKEKKTVDDLIFKTPESFSSLKKKTILPKKVQSANETSSIKTFSTASNGGMNNFSQITKKSSNLNLHTAIPNESEDVITDSFVPYGLRGPSSSKTKIDQNNNSNISKKYKCVNEASSDEMLVVLDDDKGNKITVNMTSIIKSFNINNATLSPHAIYMNGNQIWKKL
uniref:Uncharacterized protein n=1 Tax=Strongyloides stercoralis TaxID=6248 RepID=A0AAF5DB89_STRER